MIRFLTAATMLTLAGCTAVDPYTQPPPSCAALRVEMENTDRRIKARTAANSSVQILRVGVPTAIALGVVPPAAAGYTVADLLFFDLETGSLKERRRFLAYTAVIRQCWKRGKMR